MATKATIQALINANLASSSMITAAEHRAVENQLLNELYPTIITVTEADTDIFTAATISGVVFTYRLNVVKIGRLVTIKGWIKLTTSSSVTERVYATITNPEYLGFVIDSPSTSPIITTNGFVAIDPIVNQYTGHNNVGIGINRLQELTAALTLGATPVHLQYFTQS